MSQPRCTLVSIGDPLSPQTWSGTPSNIARALRELGWTVSGISGRLPFWGRLLCALEAGSLKGSLRARRSFRRRLTGRVVARRLSNRPPGPVLHMGGHTLPIPDIRDGETHCLFLDSTWNLAGKNAVEGVPASDQLFRVFDATERAAYDQVREFFPVSNYVSENLIAHYGRDPQHIHVVGTGLGRIQAYDGPKDYTRPHLLFTAKGRFLDKGGPMVVEAFDIARKRLPQLRLTIVGSDKGREFVTNPAIDVHGFVPLETLQKLFEKSSLFVLPAPYEPWGLVYLEAMACGMPIIGLDRNAFPEFCSGERHGWTLRQADPLHLADLLVEAFAAPDLLEKKGRAARDFVGQRYSWRKTAERITRVLQNHL